VNPVIRGAACSAATAQQDSNASNASNGAER
jgi:hypothetical protein